MLDSFFGKTIETVDLKNHVNFHTYGLKARCDGEGG